MFPVVLNYKLFVFNSIPVCIVLSCLVLPQGLVVLPLHLAASYRRVKSMQSLLSAGTDPEMRSGQTHAQEYGYTVHTNT